MAALSDHFFSQLFETHVIRTEGLTTERLVVSENTHTERWTYTFRQRTPL